MLDKNVFKKEFNRLLIFFPNWDVDFEDRDKVSVWYSQFENMTDSEFSKMINRYINKERFNPTVSSLKEHYVKEEREPTIEEQIEDVNGLLGLGKDYFKMNGNPERYEELQGVKEELEKQL